MENIIEITSNTQFMIQNTLFVTKTTAFMATVEKIITYALGEDDTGPVPV